ncbi:hypothetical protein FK268_08775 [Tsukamurella sputi]|uniref:DUF1648 domain-containing protein n=1 Tax=Tsukamurella sputi TaxID=2591848 RepID=A0A5C5RSM2_9ACTN|nr:hypothetical protein [Tsukamurella sputi]TWS25281.1 hypothetical protein FK268_08775 [Tsukamurella sputi]
MRARWWSFLGTVIAYAAASAWAAVSGPDPFPTHFGLSGHPLTWSPRGEAVVVHTLIAAGIAVVFAGLALVAPRIPSSLINTPRRDYWLSPAHRPRFDAIVSGFLLWTGGLLLLQRAATVVVTIIDADETAAKSTLLVLFLLAVVGSVGYLLWSLWHPPTRSMPTRGAHPDHRTTRSRR